MRNQVERLVCLDANLSDVEVLRQGVVANSIVVDLQTVQDGFTQIAVALSQFAVPVTELHIVSHGRPGCLDLAGAQIDRAALSQYAAVFAQWQRYLADDAAIYLYACEVGAGLVGRQFVAQLSQLLDRPVAASETLTGASQLGGDWELAVRIGQIPMALAFTPAAQQNYSGVLINPDFNFTNLSAAPLYNNGDAVWANGALQLTSDKTFQRSSSFYVAPIELDDATSFSTSFQFRLGGSAGTLGSDGFTFTLQNSAAGVAALGFDGGNMGYGGIERSFAVEFDTYQNEGIDISDNSIAIIRDGDVSKAIAAVNASVDLNDGELYTAWIDYDGDTNLLSVYLGTGEKPLTALLSTQVDLVDVLGNQAYLGFTGASGSVQSEQKILNWSFQSDDVRVASTRVASSTAAVNLANDGASEIDLNGAATLVNGAIDLTPEGIQRRGSAFYKTPIQVSDNLGFATRFKFRLDGAAGTQGSDGFTFALHNNASASRAIGAVGGNLGIGGVTESLVIKFDTFKNIIDPQTPNFPDPSDNHVAILLNGDITKPLNAVNLPFDLNDGGEYTAWIEYDGTTNQLQVFVSNGTDKPATAVITAEIDLPAIVGNQFYAGFTAATGAKGNRQTITDWQFETDVQIGTGQGLRGEYFDNADFTNLRLVRIDPTINYDWGTGSPEPDIAPDTFSVRWTGQVQPLYGEEYTFYTVTNDGVRLTINNQVVIDNLVNQATTESSGTIALEAGQKYDIVLEYFENTQEAEASLAWSSLSQNREIIPQSQLYTVPYNPGTIIMGSEAFIVKEDEGTATVRIDRVNGSDGYATVNYNTVNVTATAGQDFVGLASNVTFAPGETSKNVTITLINDDAIEAIEQFGVALGQTSGAGLGTRRTVNITVLDDDSGVAIFDLNRTTYAVDEDAGSAVITVERSGDTTIPATVNYATTNGTATAGQDYTATTGTLSFAANELTKTFLIPITDDAAVEVNETLQITISAPTDGRLGDVTTATLTISDNDIDGEFQRQAILSNLLEPTAFEFAPAAPNGGPQLLFVAEKRGTVRVLQNEQLQSGFFIDISPEVNNVRDRGLIGIAVHPDFYTGSPYIYLSYTYDPPEAAQAPQGSSAGRDGVGNRPSRVLRITADAATGYTRAVANSAVVILGRNSNWANTSRPDLNSTSDFSVPSSGLNPDGSWVQDFLASDSESHSIGDVAFGPDGALYVSNGDGASYSNVDPRAARVMDVNNLSGKLLRIDPINGNGLSDNPFFNGDPTSNASKVWNLGLRNPFRFTFNPETGDPVIGDVGWTQWEEVNVGARGANFGWPFFEGGDGSSNRTGGYSSLQSAQDFYASGTTVTPAAYAYLHDNQNAVVVGDFYDGPAPNLDNALFTADASRGTIDILFFNQAGTDVVNTQRFQEDVFGVVQMMSGPDGAMYFVTLGFGGNPGTLERFVYQ